MTTAERNELATAKEEIANLKASNASLVIRNDELYRALQLSEKQGAEQAETIRKAGLREYTPIAFRSNRELLGMRQRKYTRDDA